MSPACEDIKVQVVLQFGVCRGLREVFLSQYGRGYPSEIVSEFEPKPGPRCRDRNLTHWLISTQLPARRKSSSMSRKSPFIAS